MLQIQIDTETLGLGPRAKILSIGAVAVESTAGLDGVQLEFYEEVDQTSYGENLDFVEDASNVAWWELRGGFKPHLDEQVPWVQAMYRLYDFFGRAFDAYRCDAEHDDYEVWANSPSFDLCKLDHHFNKALLPAPWSFWNERDFRTVQAQAKKLNLAIDRPDAPHHALEDAKIQMRYVQRVEATLAQMAQKANEVSYGG